MEKQYLVVFPKQEGELVNSYSIVEESLLSDLPEIVAKTELEAGKLYTTEELEAIRDSLIV